MTGILFIAGGNKMYADLANNLIMSIRANSQVPIHVLTYGEAEKFLQKDLITSWSEIPESARVVRGKENFFLTKTQIYDLTPFDTTMFLDADMILFDKNIEGLINELKDVDFTIQNRARVSLDEDYSKVRKPVYFWADIKEIQSKYKGFIYSLHSEFIWFKKSEENKKYFDLVKEIYLNPPVQTKLFAGDVADELAFALACNILDKKPHKEPFAPIYWWQLDGKKDGYILHKLSEKYYGYSVGGNKYSVQTIADNYNILAHIFAKKFGQREVRLVPKYKVLKERQVM